jgi:hypothetical protein
MDGYDFALGQASPSRGYWPGTGWNDPPDGSGHGTLLFQDVLDSVSRHSAGVGGPHYVQVADTSGPAATSATK